MYFSDREHGIKRPTATELTTKAWSGIAAAIRKRVNDGSFGATYPDMCIDGRGPVGTDERSFWGAMEGEIPELIEVQNILFEPESPPLLVVMDMIEFCWKTVGKPIVRDHHSYFGHDHLRFDIEVGRYEFQDQINLIFQRNQLAYELTEQGNIQRILEPDISQVVHMRYQTKDATLNELLESARQKFVSPDIRERRESIKCLWDAWERVKTIHNKDKKIGISKLLDTIADSPDSRFRSMLEQEAKELTFIGNSFEIRHSERNQERLNLIEHVDYLWYRMYVLLHLVLRLLETD